MSKNVSFQKNGVNHLIEQTIFKLFTPSNKSEGAKAKVNFLAPPETENHSRIDTEIEAESPSTQVKKRIIKENSFSLQDSINSTEPKSLLKPEYSELIPEPKLLHTGFNIAVTFSNPFKLPVKIYGRRGFESDFKFLALDTYSPYMDNRPKLDSNLAEEREYKVVFFDFDTNTEVGKMSEIVKISI